MADDKNNSVIWIVGLIVTAAISAGFAIMSQSAKTQAANTQSDIHSIGPLKTEVSSLKQTYNTARSEMSSLREQISYSIRG